jgi:hypothetical protein
MGKKLKVVKGAMSREKNKIMERIADLYPKLLEKAVNETTYGNGKWLRVSIEAINNRFEFLLRQQLEKEGFRPELIDWALKQLSEIIQEIDRE